MGKFLSKVRGYQEWAEHSADVLKTTLRMSGDLVGLMRRDDLSCDANGMPQVIADVAVSVDSEADYFARSLVQGKVFEKHHYFYRGENIVGLELNPDDSNGSISKKISFLEIVDEREKDFVWDTGWNAFCASLSWFESRCSRENLDAALIAVLPSVSQVGDFLMQDSDRVTRIFQGRVVVPPLLYGFDPLYALALSFFLKCDRCLYFAQIGPNRYLAGDLR